MKQVGGELGVRYVLEGSVRRSGNKLRITAQMIDAHSNAHIWSDRYDGDLADVFDLQDRITESIIGALQPTIRSAEISGLAASGRKASTPMTWSCGRSPRSGTTLAKRILSSSPFWKGRWRLTPITRCNSALRLVLRGERYMALDRRSCARTLHRASPRQEGCQPRQ